MPKNNGYRYSQRYRCHRNYEHKSKHIHMHPLVDTCLGILDMNAYMTFDCDDTLLNAARHCDS
jgi:hypothetical protein